MIKIATKNLKNVVVISDNGLVANYCKNNNVNIIIRGMRNYNDYENEFQLYQYNKDINPSVETFLMMPTTKNQFISSSAIKELIMFNVDISKYVPAELVDTIVNKYKKIQGD